MARHIGWIGALLLALPHAAGAQSRAVDAVLDRLTLQLPDDVLVKDAVRRPLDELQREKCDKEAIASLGKGLQAAGYRREAAVAHIRYSETCNGHPESLRTAINIMLKLSDNKGAAAVAADLIKAEPYVDNGYFLRALANDRAGNPKKAVDDYITAIELFGNKEKISSYSYEALAKNYEKLGQHCDAALAIEAFVAINYVRNDTSQTRAMISGYQAKGNCAAGKGVEETIPVVRQNNVVIVPVTINGIAGKFILDTGATYVSVKSTFALRAKITPDKDSTVQLHTANGTSEGRLARAKTVQLRSLTASEVPVVVQTDAKGTYGDGIDGLLGMSFLSRFNVTMDGRSVKLRTRK
jgi:clan AA aspartic protease (TIGR02281 family)